MNLVILYPQDFIDHQQVILSDRRYEHIRNIHQAQEGDQLQVGLLNQKMGVAHITDINDTSVSLSVTLDQTAPQPLPLTLIIALPRPKMLKRILQTCATMGVKKIIFINSYRVEKSYWQTPLLTPEKIDEQLILGLEQGKDTLLPEVILEKRFKPFVEDRLPNICQNTLALVAHPIAEQHCPHCISETCTLVIGPEGGFIPYEIEKLNEAGCNTIHLGERILRVETAIPVLLSKLFDAL
jgi:RsmE family RNA methyltransferase